MKLSQLGVAIAAGAITLGATILTAPVSQAEPESTIQSECKSAGGTYTTTVISGHRYSKCCYTDAYGTQTCDSYDDGTYVVTCTASSCDSELAPPNNGSPSHRPVHPPIAPVAPPEAVP